MRAVETVVFKESLHFVRSDCSRMIEVACLECFKEIEFGERSHLLSDPLSLDLNIKMSSEKLFQADSGFRMEVLLPS